MKNKLFKIFKAVIKRWVKKPELIISLSFLILILIGAILLTLPIASKSGKSIGFINALFTSASASCVTGLVVVNTTSYWSVFGKFVIILLIQMGGLGTMLIISLVSLILGRKIGLTERLLIKEGAGLDSYSGIVKLSKNIIIFSLVVEFIGASVLYIRLNQIYGSFSGLIYSIFHSISAFCNAGFDIFGNSLVDFKGDLVINLSIAFLIIIGGLGYSVFYDVYKSRRFRKLALHSKVALTITAFLILFGTISFYLLENKEISMHGFTQKEKILSSFFMSVTSRTAGFNSLNIGLMKGSSVVLTILLMFIGASPASTGGGIKTTTFGVLVMSTFSVLRGDEEVSIFKKRIPMEVILRSITIFFFASGIVLFVSMVITLIEGEKFFFLDILYETVSAFGTVGITRGITPFLSNISKIILTFLMFIGRVGPTTVALGLLKRKNKKSTKYAKGKIIVG